MQPSSTLKVYLYMQNFLQSLMLKCLLSKWLKCLTVEGALSFPTSSFPPCFFLTSAEPQLALRVPCFHCRLQPAGVEAPDNGRGVSDSQVTHTLSTGLGAEETWVESGMIQHLKAACRCSDTNSLSTGLAEEVLFITFLS